VPSETFFNLPEEKSYKILKAAKREFSRVPISEAKVSNIVAEAGIARGSFYVYFDSIEELAFYMFKKAFDSPRIEMEEQIEASHGDLIATFKSVFRKYLIDVVESGDIVFYRNVFIELHSIKCHTHEKPHEKPRNQFDTVSAKTDMTLYDLPPEDIGYLGDLLFGVFMSIIRHLFMTYQTDEKWVLDKILHEFDTKIAIIENGARNKEEK
jgi:AcrR family transcriptional regulator